MQIRLDNTGKRFNREWIFRGIDHTFEPNKHTVILGSNGSGKSTLLKVISGYASPSEGNISFSVDGQVIEREKIFASVSLAAPYMDIYEEFTLEEMFNFQSKFKPCRVDIDRNLKDILQLPGAGEKLIREYSSGMRQRVKLGLAILADTPILLLDEPTSNLDSSGIEWYKSMMEQYGKDRIIIVCSNQQKDEYGFCSEELRVEDYKQ